MNKRIFLSYNHKDKEIADLVTKILSDAGFSIIRFEERITDRQDSMKKLFNEVSSSGFFVPILTENYLNSTWALAELSVAAMAADKIIIASIVIGENLFLPSYVGGYSYYRVDNAKAIDSNHLLSLFSPLEKSVPTKNTKYSEEIDYVNDNLETTISRLKEAISQNRLTLVCGAGVSVDAGIANWHMLLVEILSKCVARIGEENSIDIHDIKIQDVEKQLTSSSLILGKYLKNVLGESFETQVKNVLYGSEIHESDIIKIIVELVRPQKNRGSIESIITFNFDSLLEDELRKNHIRNKPIYDEAMQYKADEIPVFHVHGYLPRYENIKNPNLVFSEDSYHTQFIEPYSWSNLIQLYKFTNNTCLFLGSSLTDPNLRRLLDIARRKNVENNYQHYIVLKSPPQRTSIDKIEKILLEQDANMLGLNVIWVPEFNYIPNILTKLIE